MNRQDLKEDHPRHALLKLASNRIEKLKDVIRRSELRGRMREEVEGDLVIAENHAESILSFIQTARRVE